MAAFELAGGAYIHDCRARRPRLFVVCRADVERDALLHEQSALERTGQLPGRAAPPIMEEQDARLLVRHVVMNGDDIDALAA